MSALNPLLILLMDIPMSMSEQQNGELTHLLTLLMSKDEQMSKGRATTRYGSLHG